MTRRRRIAAALIAASLATGCGVSYPTDLLASIEGRWMCDVQRYTFDDVGDIQTELDGRLTGNGVTAEQYRAFKDDLIDDAALRDVVAVEYAAYCDGGT